MDIQLLSFILLLIMGVSDFFIILILRRQWKLRKTKTHPRLMTYRRVLSLLAILIFVGNIYPILLNLYSIFVPSIRTSQTVNLVGVIYSLDNALTFMIASILIYALYKLADTVIEIAELIGIRAVKSGTIMSDNTSINRKERK